MLGKPFFEFFRRLIEKFHDFIFDDTQGIGNHPKE